MFSGTGSELKGRPLSPEEVKKAKEDMRKYWIAQNRVLKRRQAFLKTYVAKPGRDVYVQAWGNDDEMYLYMVRANSLKQAKKLFRAISGHDDSVKSLNQFVRDGLKSTDKEVRDWIAKPPTPVN